MIKEYEKNSAAFVSRVKELAASESLTSLKERAKKEKGAEETFAAVYLAANEALGLTPFDTQIMTGAELHDEKAVELATGEGKTLAAVFAACFGAIKGEHINIFTFNDYLAKRDCLWMKPVYDLMGISVSYVTEQTPKTERKAAYGADVVYSTANECGFDYLRDFLAERAEDTVSGEFCRAIVDEADSVLIDEARLPLVAAGNVAVEQDERLSEVLAFVKSLGDTDYEADASAESAYLTESGAEKAEKHYKTDNIYDEENNDLMSRINDCLKALYILEENRDYIVKNGGISLIDAFTGRAAEGRNFPGTLQTAVELKHGLKVTERGTVMAEIAVQNFIRLFPKLSGMTGTALSAKDEFNEMYGLIAKRIEPNTPSIRVDLPMAVYYDEDSKLSAVTEEILRANAENRPVLVGTDSIAQSEALSAMLSERGAEHSVLNAKNDEAEAEIISAAGMPSAITISTNMAGRGVDIKLGGADEAKKDEAASAGGLYVIGTFMAESARMNSQLSGRAARQGDPGQSRLFVSLDEKIMERCKLKKLVGSRHYPEPASEELTDKVLIKEISRVQRISQGKTLDERVRLMKFHIINEKHRQAFFSARKGYLDGSLPCTVWEKNFPGLLAETGKLPEGLEQRAAASVLNRCWIEYLEYTSALRDGIHLSAIGGKDPGEEYNIACENYYLELEERITDYMGDILTEIKEKGADNITLPFPKKTWTYLLSDNGDELERRSLMSAIFGDSEDESDEEEEEQPVKEEKTGFFAKLLGKKR